MSPPSLPPETWKRVDADGLAVARKVLDSLRFRIERLIDQELSAIPRTGGKTVRIVVPPSPTPELFDDETGEQIFG